MACYHGFMVQCFGIQGEKERKWPEGCPDNVGRSKYKNGKQFQGFVKGLYKIPLCALQSHLAGISWSGMRHVKLKIPEGPGD